MKGYILHSHPNRIVPPKDGWHDTGDIVDVDEDGFVIILDRAKRFAKIAGEMVSLTAVERIINQSSPHCAHAIIAGPCAKKGEQLILFTEDTTLDKRALISRFKKAQAPDIWLPKTIIYGDIPRLPTGKVNYQALRVPSVSTTD